MSPTRIKTPTAPAAETCRHCGSGDLFTVACQPPSPHHARTGCRRCKRFVRFEPAPMTEARAASFVMPFGRFKGRTLAEVTTDPDGARYLRWLLGAGPTPSIARAVACHLESLASAHPTPG